MTRDNENKGEAAARDRVAHEMMDSARRTMISVFAGAIFFEHEVPTRYHMEEMAYARATLKMLKAAGYPINVQEFVDEAAKYVDSLPRGDLLDASFRGCRVQRERDLEEYDKHQFFYGNA